MVFEGGNAKCETLNSFQIQLYNAYVYWYIIVCTYNIFFYVHTYVRMYVHMYVFTYVCMYTYMWIYVKLGVT